MRVVALLVLRVVEHGVRVEVLVEPVLLVAEMLEVAQVASLAT